MKGYIILDGYTKTQLENEVNLKLLQGYVLIGGVCSDGKLLYQAMAEVKKK